MFCFVHCFRTKNTLEQAEGDGVKTQQAFLFVLWSHDQSGGSRISYPLCLMQWGSFIPRLFVPDLCAVVYVNTVIYIEMGLLILHQTNQIPPVTPGLHSSTWDKGKTHILSRKVPFFLDVLLFIFNALQKPRVLTWWFWELSLMLAYNFSPD